MGLSQFIRIIGISFSVAALACVSVWLAGGAAAPPSEDDVRVGTPNDHYVSFEFEGHDAAATQLLAELTKDGYPASDTFAGTYFGTPHDHSHNIVISKNLTQSEANAVAKKIIKEYSPTSWDIGPLQNGSYMISNLFKGKYSFARIMVFGFAGDGKLVARGLLFVIAFSVSAAALLALLLLIRGHTSSTNRLLGGGLACWALAISYLWLFAVAPPFQQYLPTFVVMPGSLPLRVLMDVMAFGLLLASSVAYIRFWKSYPQPISDEELDRFLEALKQEQLIKAGKATRRWLKLFRRKEGAAPSPDNRPASDFMTPPQRQRYLKPVLVGLVTLLSGLAWSGGFIAPPLLALPGILLEFFTFVLLIYLPGITCLRVFRYHRSAGSAEDCRKIEWIWAAMWLGLVVILLPCVFLAVIRTGRYFSPELEVYVHFADMLFIFGVTSGPLLVILALGVSILYRGSIDPRLALRGLTVWSVLGIFLTLVFVLVERSIAVRLARWWNLSPQTGYVTAGAMVAATFQPLRKYTEKNVTHFVERAMPTTVLSSGTRRTLAVVVVDITGYTALSAKDEQAALLASALVQKEARRFADGAGGRVVKSTGDGVIMAFPDAGKALDSIRQLYRAVQVSTKTLNLPEIRLHSGLHWGEVVEMRDGDIYGMTVNLAARLADWAKAGEIGVSQIFHAQLGADTLGFEDLGSQSFKNVPEPMSCLKLKDA